MPRREWLWRAGCGGDEGEMGATSYNWTSLVLYTAHCPICFCP